jgi:integral membrane protein
VSGALLRYRLMAYVVGTGLLILVVIGVPLQYGAGHPGVVTVVGPIHGFLYIVYLLAAYDLARRAHFRPVRLLAMVAAGLLPGLAFVIEHRITAQLRAELAAAGTTVADADSGEAVPGR